MSSHHSASFDDILAERGRREDDYAIELAEERHRKHRWRCKDRSCGALDCPTCYPFTHAQPTEEDN